MAPDAGPASRNARIFWGTAVAVLLADLVTKALAVAFLPPIYVPRRVVGDVVRFTLAYNPGAAFSISVGPHSRLIFGAFAAVAIVLLWRLYRGSAPGDRLRVLALGLATGGAAGNLYDRIRSPLGVVDFIDIGIGNLRFWTFNVADAAVTVGAVILAWVLWHEDDGKTPIPEGSLALAAEEQGSGGERAEQR